jgi:hypothetical protein
MEHGEEESRTTIIPAGVGVGEAQLLLDLFAQLRTRRFGRLEVTVSDGRLMDIELVERVDRRLLRGIGPHR